MIILGDDLVPYEALCFVNNIEEISLTKPNTTLIFKFDKKLLKHCFENHLDYAVIVFDIKESIYANSLNAKYIISEKELSIKIQKIADNYMFDSKNITIIESNREFENVANNEIDGVMYSSLL